MLVVPAVTPVTTPPDVIVATDVALLLQLPPDVTSVNVIVEFSHTTAAAAMAAGNGLTKATVVL